MADNMDNNVPTQQSSSSHCCDDKVSNKGFDDYVKWVAGILITCIGGTFWYLSNKIDCLESKYLNDHDHLSRLSRIESTYQSDHDKLIVLETRINSKFQK